MSTDLMNFYMCYKKQYCIGTWNIRSINQGKLEVVRQKMARVNINILGISEPRWTGMGEFNSDDHYIYYCGQESLRRNRIALIVNKRVQNTVLGCNLKNDRMISVHFQGKPFNMPANLENSVVATELEKVIFHSNPKERQCQRMFKLLRQSTHLTR